MNWEGLVVYLRRRVGPRHAPGRGLKRGIIERLSSFDVLIKWDDGLLVEYSRVGDLPVLVVIPGAK